MTSNKPYFIRALYEWILDNHCTPYIIVDATRPFVEVPEQFISEGKIILNILPSATHNLHIGDDWVTFSARFAGVSQDINVPMGAIAAIYAQENGEGMGFETEALPEDYFTESILKIPSKTSEHKPQLNIIETNPTADGAETSPESSSPSITEPADTKAPQTTQNTPKSSANKGKKPTLTIIK